MRKSLALMLVMPCLSFATDIYIGTISCRDYQFNQKTTTLQTIKDKCMVEEKLPSNGLTYLKFTNSSTGKKIKCYFADDLPTARITYCE